MILYFDNFITDKSLNAGSALWSDEVRRGKAAIYRMPSKLDISLYTLASYAALDWSAVVIKYTVDDKEKKAYFESQVRSLFPKAIMLDGRSDSAQKFSESAKLLRSLGDEWIFYAGNSDYPFIGADAQTIKGCLTKAAELKKNSKFVSIYLAPSLFGLALSDPSSLAYDRRWSRTGENEDCAWCEVSGGYFDAIQIVHIDLFEHWFAAKGLEKARARIFRSDSVENFVDVPVQSVVVPKKDICFHFDGLSHLAIHGYGNPDPKIPPLFIPPGFFEGKVRIAYGYDEYREGWVNVNPAKEKYSFEGKGGADLKIGLQELPLFWKGRIEKIDANPDAKESLLEQARKKNATELAGLWKSTPSARLAMKLRRAAWIATKGVPQWGRRARAWLADPSSLDRVLDERDRGTEGKVKLAAKRIAHAAISAGHRIGLLKKKG